MTMKVEGRHQREEVQKTRSVFSVQRQSVLLLLPSPRDPAVCLRARVVSWTRLHNGGIEPSEGSQRPRPQFQTNIIFIEPNIDPHIQIVRQPNGLASRCQAGRARPGSISQHLTRT
ncbi:hypothetical protein GBF38_018223 [Nibea albiflora]|uniref:Uncharacterized protein n=1 Tax=Nibea albiflora TaxID=240163 RepID=A0ACB7EFE6_NIBAL|nr:hypothetical protein GBF38_018223 [Nibea albiflora]